MYFCNTMPSAGTAVHIALLEPGQPLRDDRDRPRGRYARPARLSRIASLGAALALETPDGPIFETAAILLWLADRHGEGWRQRRTVRSGGSS